MTGIEGLLTPGAVVAKFTASGIQISERTLRAKARQLGAYRQIGRTMFFAPEDIEKILEEARPAPKSAPTVPMKPQWTEQQTEELLKKLRSPKRRR